MLLDLFRKVVRRRRSDPELNDAKRPFRTTMIEAARHGRVDSIDADQLQALVEWQPHAMAVNVSNNDSRRNATLLHALCRHGATPHSLRLLEICLRANPGTVFLGYPHTPLRLLRVNSHSLEVIRALFLELLDSYLTLRSDTGATILHELYTALLRGYPGALVVLEAEEVLLEITREAARLQPDLLLAVDKVGGNCNGDTILHRCLSQDNSTFVANFALRLLEICPQLASIPNGLSVWPLHLAVGINRRRRLPVPMRPLIARLVDLCPEALLGGKIDDTHGWLTPLEVWMPIHEDENFDLCTKEIDVGDSLEVKQNRQAFWDVVEMMAVRVGRMTIMESGDESISDAACQLHAILGSIDLYFVFLHYAIWNLRLFDWRTADAAGTLPIFKIVTQTPSYETRFDLCCLCKTLCEIPTSAQFAVSTVTPDSKGQFALHVGLRMCNFRDREVWEDDYSHCWPARYHNIIDPVAVILDAMTLGSGAVLTRQSPRNGLRPFEIAATEGIPDFCFELLRRSPDVIMDVPRDETSATVRTGSVLCRNCRKM